MEPNFNERSPNSNPAVSSGVCRVCHQPVLPTYYFCPNCGTKLSAAPLSTAVSTQIGIYLFSIILPWIVFIFVTRWQGLKYSRSNDPKTRRIGLVAWILLILSTVFMIWFYWWSIVVFQNWIQAYVNSTTSDLNNLNLQ